MIINLISSPRNVSTALMYSFANREDVFPIDEPFYGYYLKKTGVEHPGRTDIIASQSVNAGDIIQEIEELSRDYTNIFVKNMAHHLIDMEVDFLYPWQNIFLIRNPKQLIASLAQVIKNPQQTDIGIKRQYELYQYLKSKGSTFHIVDSGILLSNPAKVLALLCERIGISMSEKMLSWSPRKLPQDGVWAKYWYANVHKSTGFTKQPTSSRPLPDDCVQLYEESKNYYQELLNQAIR